MNGIHLYRKTILWDYSTVQVLYNNYYLQSSGKTFRYCRLFENLFRLLQKYLRFSLVCSESCRSIRVSSRQLLVLVPVLLVQQSVISAYRSNFFFFWQNKRISSFLPSAKVHWFCRAELCKYNKYGTHLDRIQAKDFNLFILIRDTGYTEYRMSTNWNLWRKHISIDSTACFFIIMCGLINQ